MNSASFDKSEGESRRDSILANLAERLYCHMSLPPELRLAVDKQRIVPTEELHGILNYYLKTGKFKDEENLPKKGRQRRPRVLEDDDVREIRRRYDSGESQSEIAKDYPLTTQQNISNICRRATRKNVA